MSDPAASDLHRPLTTPPKKPDVVAGVVRAETIMQGWAVTIVLIGVSHLGVAIGLIMSGDQAMSLPVFRATNSISWEVWAMAAFVGSLFILFEETRLVGLIMTAVWYAMWSSLLIIGILAEGGPYQSIAVYLLLVALHVLAVIVEWRLWRWRAELG